MVGSGLKQKAVTAIVVMAVLYAAAVGVWFLTVRTSWKKAAQGYETACKAYAAEEALIDQGDMWAERYKTARDQMHMFTEAESKHIDTTWIEIVSRLAEENFVRVTDMNANNKADVDDEVHILPITGIRFEASLEAVVRFMYALDTSTEGVFNVRDLTLDPINNKPGYLKGTCEISCAYMVEE